MPLRRERLAAHESFTVRGHPATFATRREAEWKESLRNQVPRPSLEGRERGLRLRFMLPTLAPHGHPLDVDNLCEPVIAVLVRHAKWFSGAKPNIQWWYASKEVAAEHGCEITISTESAPAMRPDAPDWSQTYAGPFPVSAKSPEVALWARHFRSSQRIEWVPESCSLSIGFGSSTVNLGDISSGVVKSFIDCLYPWIGGDPGDPEDYRISKLLVQKSTSDVPPDSVQVALWATGEIARPPAPDPTLQSQHNAPDASRSSARPIAALRNPCRPGTAKWLVCEAAMHRRLETEVRTELDELRKGAANQLTEYISDLRSENRLDIRIEGGALVCHGQIGR